jgi:hypothetical protein
MLAKVCSSTLNPQFIRVQRTVVSDGRWAKWWQCDGGRSCTLAPVMWLLSRGFGDIGAYAQAHQLALLTGFDPRTLSSALRDVEETGTIERLDVPHAGVVRFRVNQDVLATGKKAGFILPGSLFGRGTWASLSNGERSVLVAIASRTRGLVWKDEDEYETRYQPEFMRWLESKRAICRVQKSLPISGAKDREDGHEYDEEETADRSTMWLARRCTEATLSCLAQLTGMNRSTVLRCVRKLENVDEGQLLSVYPYDRGTFFHLPEPRWADWSTQCDWSLKYEGHG